MEVYITGMCPPVCHVDKKCFGILFGGKVMEVESLADVPTWYEACMFCHPLGIVGLGKEQRARVEELKELLGGKE